MAAQSLSSDIRLPVDLVTDSKKNPDVYLDLLNITNSIKLLQQYLDLFISARTIATASESISVGSMVNLFGSGGVLFVQNANASTQTKQCTGYALSSASAGTALEIQTFGVHQLISGLTPGTTYYLSTIAGKITATPPSGVGQVRQEVGIALDPNTLLFRPAGDFKLL